MATPKSGRQSRKRRRPAAGARTVRGGADAAGLRRDGDPAAPAGDVAAPAVEIVPRSAREALRPAPRPRRGRPSAQGSAAAESRQRQPDTMMGTYGERPESPFGGLPVSEVLILAGAVGTVYGLVASAPIALAVGLVACVLGVGEFTVREHFSGYRSHTTLLAAGVAIAVGIAMIALLGGSLNRGLLLGVVLPVFVVCFVLLRRRFRVARHARIARRLGG